MIKIMKNLFLQTVVLLFLLAMSDVFAEPSKAIKYLMTEETSLFDRGMDRLDAEFDGMEISNIGYFMTNVAYNGDENRITITSTLSPNSRDAETKSEAKEWCKLTLDRMKLILGVNGSTGQSLHEHSYLNQFFSHYGYMNNRKTGGPGKELDWITRLKASIRYKGKDKFGSYVSCEARLIDTKVSFSDS